jgi:hypothetical protein
MLVLIFFDPCNDFGVAMAEKGPKASYNAASFCFSFSFSFSRFSCLSRLYSYSSRACCKGSFSVGAILGNFPSLAAALAALGVVGVFCGFCFLGPPIVHGGSALSFTPFLRNLMPSGVVAYYILYTMVYFPAH